MKLNIQILSKIIGFLFVSHILVAAELTSSEELPQGISYEKKKTNNHIIHILKVDSKRYHFELVKAHNRVFGRETVKSIALRKNAIAAINAGFFEIGNSEDGRPSGTLIIDNNIFTLSNQPRNYLAWNNHNQFYVGKANIFLALKINNQILVPNEINQFSENNETILYNAMWGNRTLTPYLRKEVMINKDHIITGIVEHGDNVIPEGGSVLSFSRTVPAFNFIQIGREVNTKLDFQNEDSKRSLDQDFQNWVVGIPLLVERGKMVKNLENSGQKSFTMAPHARTAFGIDRDGTIIMVVAEHFYKQPMNLITLEELHNILLKKGHTKEEISKMSLSELRAFAEQHFSSDSVQGLSLPELAKLMLQLGCEKAINLDGGGSSTMVINNHIMNTPMGDADESNGQAVLRPVSNAIVVLRRE